MTTPVADSTGYGPNMEMSALGYITGALIFILLLPLLPFVIIGWILLKLLGTDDNEPRRRSWKRNFGGA